MHPLRLSLFALLFLAVLGMSGNADAKEPEWSYDTGNDVEAVAVSADGEYIAAGDDDGYLHLFDKNNIYLWKSDELAHFGINSVAISANGDYIVVGSSFAPSGGGGEVYLFSKDNSSYLWHYTTQDDVWSVAISADGEYIVAGANREVDETVYFFSKDSSTPLWITDIGRVESVSISADGEYITAGSNDDKVYLFDKDSSTPLWSYDTGDDVRSVAISTDGEYITAGSYDNKVYLFDKDSSTPLWSHDTQGDVLSVDISADGQYIVAGSTTHYVYLFDKDDNGGYLWAHATEGNVFSVSISVNGEYITGSSGSKVYLWSKDSSTPLWSHTTGDYVNSIAISADSEYITAGSDDDKVYLFNNDEVDADDPEFDFRFDYPTDGTGNIDTNNTLDLKVEIENLLSDPKDFRLDITNDGELQSNGLRAWWSHDGQTSLSSESTQLPSVDIGDNGTVKGITVTIEATENTLYGEYKVDLRCKDKDDSDPEGTKQTIQLTVNVNEKVGVSMVIAGGGSREGSVDLGGETTYWVQVNNEGNREDTFSLTISSNYWDSSFSESSVTIAAFSNQIVALTVVSDSDANYGDGDTQIITATSGNSDNIMDTLYLTTWVRVHYGIGLTAVSQSESGEPGETLTFNFKILNKWSESVNYEIVKKDWYRGTPSNPPDQGWSFTDGTGTLDAFEEITTPSSSSVKVTISSSADAGEVVTIIVQAKVTDDNDNVGTIELEIEVRVEGDYNVQLILPQSDQINLHTGQFFSITNYIQLKNFAKVNDLVTITAVWENGGEDWTLIVPDPIVIEASGEKLLFISVQAPESAAGSQATLKIRAESGGNPSVYDEATLTFRVEAIYVNPEPETEILDSDDNETSTNNSGEIETVPSLSLLTAIVSIGFISILRRKH